MRPSSATALGKVVELTRLYSLCLSISALALNLSRALLDVLPVVVKELRDCRAPSRSPVLAIVASYDVNLVYKMFAKLLVLMVLPRERPNMRQNVVASQLT